LKKFTRKHDETDVLALKLLRSQEKRDKLDVESKRIKMEKYIYQSEDEQFQISNKYFGMFQKGKKHGLGTLHNSFGFIKKFKGNWRND